MPSDKEIMDKVRKALGQEILGTDEQKEFSIYWGKKNIAIATKLIEEFLPDGGSILDPFVGSGSTIYGALQGSSTNFVTGVDVNEQPISQIRFNLEECNPISYAKADIFFEELKSIFSDNYTYIINGEKHIFQKCILNLESGLPTISDFLLRSSETGENLNITSNHPSYEYVCDRYLQIQTTFSNPTEDLQLKTNSRIAVKPGMKISDMYSPLNFNILLWMRSKIANEPYLRGLLSSVLHLTKYTDKGSQSQFPFWYPKKDAIDRNLIKLLEEKHKQIKKKKPGDENLFAAQKIENSYALFNVSIKEVGEYLGSKSQDLVITDPPYFDQVAYSEYLVPWEFFCHSRVNMEDEIVESNRIDANKTRETYLEDMSTAFDAIRNTCKDQALMFFYYKDARLINIYEILLLLERVGWNFVGQTHIDKKGFSYKQNSSKSTTVEGDCLMVFQVSEPREIRKELKDSKEKADEFVIMSAKEYVSSTKASTLSEIYDNVLVKSLYSRGYLGYYKSPQDIITLLLRELNFEESERKFYV
jgi:DNA modification methylase